MGSNWANWKARWRQWEVYAFHFMAYIFHSEDGKKMRGRFVKQVLGRTFVYCLWGLPFFGVLYLIHWVPQDLLGATLGFLFLVVDIAAGTAIIRTVADYRHRVELLYRLDPTTGTTQEEAVPVAHREVAPPPEFKIKLGQKEIPKDPAEYLATLLPDPSTQVAAEPEPQPEIPPDAKVVFECTSCQRRITPSSRENATKIERCIFCGGQLKMRTL